MRSFSRILAMMALAGVSVLAPAVANASGTAGENTNVSTLVLKGPLANAIFSETDPTGCIETDVFVTSNGEIARQSVETYSNGYAAVTIFKQDICNNTLLFSASGEKTSLAPGELVVSNQLDRATLSTTIQMVNDQTQAAFPVTVDLTWVGISDIYRNRSFSNELLGGRCRVIDRWRGTGREADVFGSVSYGATNFTPAGSLQSAEIGDVISGAVVIQCA